MSLRRFIQVGFLVMLSPSALAFSGDEHREISNLALTIAIDFRCPDDAQSPIARCDDIRGVAKELAGGNEKLLSYGEITEVVDFLHYPQQVLDANLYPLSKKSLNQHAKEVLDKKDDVLFDYLSASSHNERHFQEDLMKSLDILHIAAINEARTRNIFRALVLSALSDHYLNDFFAPGHITTQRENSHDTVAMAMHDWANRAGTCLKINSGTWSELDSYLKFIERRKDYVLFDEIDDFELANDNLRMCGNTTNLDLTDLKVSEFQRPIILNLTSSHDQIYLKGDGRLHRNPKQKLFMLLVQVQSISEVIGSYINCPKTPACQDPTNSTTKYEWLGTYRGGKVEPPEARIRYGYYDINPDYEEQNFYGFLKRPKYAYPAVADNAFLLSFGGQALSDEPARFEAQFEVLPMKIGSAWKKWRDKMIQQPSSECKVRGAKYLCNIGLTFGVTHSRSNDVKFTGGQFRIIKVWPKISGYVSLNLRRGKYEIRNSNVESWHSSYGIRYSHGFSLNSFYVGYQRGHGIGRNGNFGREDIANFGWTISFPSSRVLNFLGGYK